MTERTDGAELHVRLNQPARDELRFLIRNAEVLRYSLLGVAEEAADGRLDCPEPE